MGKDDTIIGCKTIFELLKRRCAETPSAAAFFTLDGDKCWHAISWSQFLGDVEKISSALTSMGVSKGDRVGIMAPTSLNWEYAQMGALSISASVAGIDPVYPTNQLDYIFRLLNLSVLFVQNRETLEKIPVELRQKIKMIILFEGIPKCLSEYSMYDLLVSMKAKNFIEPQRLSSGDEAVIVFSSGTTSNPKAIMYSHEQVLVAINVILNTFSDLKSNVVLLCWLPLANLFQRIINFSAIGVGASSYILSNPQELMYYIGSVNPHILIGVPKVFERVHDGIRERVEKQKWVIRCLVQWAVSLGLKDSRLKFPYSFFLRLVDKLVLRRFRMVFGTRIRYLVSGSAPMPIWLLEWFEAIGLPVLEAYGVSENIIPIAINRREERKLGTVGKPLLPNQLTIASDGEILVRGPGVFRGYLEGVLVSDQNQSSSNDYWHTGDLGCLDAEGFLSLTGRKTDVFKTAAGKWISPIKIEEHFQHLAYIEQCIVCQLGSQKIMAIVSVDGEKCRYKSGLVCSEEESKKDFFHRVMCKILQSDVDAVLQKLPVYQRPLGMVVTCSQFTVVGGELTTNLKIRRKKIVEQFIPHLRRLEAEIMELFSTGTVDNKANFKPIIHIL